MHPSINFDNQEVKSAFEQQQRETRHAWWLPLVLLLGIALEIYFAEQPETFETEHYLFALIIGGIGIYSLYALWIYYRDSKSVPITPAFAEITATEPMGRTFLRCHNFNYDFPISGNNCFG